MGCFFLYGTDDLSSTRSFFRPIRPVPAFPLVHQLEGEKGRAPVQQLQKDPVPRPHGQTVQLLLGQPFQNALVAFPDLPLKPGGGEQVHILTGPDVRHKGDDAPVLIIGEGQAGLLFDLPQDAVLRAFPVLELAAHADPFITVFVLLLFDPVEHEITAVFFDVAKGGLLAHDDPSFCHCPPARTAPRHDTVVWIQYTTPPISLTTPRLCHTIKLLTMLPFRRFFP